jgi:predicted aspartyl protease
MGTFSVIVSLPKGYKIEALVDTGATFSKLPARILRKLRVHFPFNTIVELGNGRKIRRKAGYIKIKLAGKSALVPVMFGKKSELPLIGATTLEILGLIPDPIKKTLVEVPHLEI